MSVQTILYCPYSPNNAGQPRTWHLHCSQQMTSVEECTVACQCCAILHRELERAWILVCEEGSGIYLKRILKNG